MSSNEGRIGSLLAGGEDPFRRIFEESSLGMAIIDRNGAYLWVNPCLCEITGYSASELLTRDFASITHPDDVSGDRDALARILAGQSNAYQTEKRYLRPDGSVVWVTLTGSELSGFEGRDRCLLVQVQDVTARKEAEEKLARREQELSRAQRVAHLGSWEWDLVTKTAHFTDEFFHIYGLLPHEVGYDEALTAYVHEDNRDWVMKVVYRSIETHEPFEFQHEIHRPDGEIRVVHARGEVVVDDGGTPVSLVGTAQDVTERVAVEERLRRSQALLQDAQRVAQVGSWDWDVATDVVTWSEELFRIYGMEPEPERRLTFGDYLEKVHPGHQDSVRASVEAALAAKESFTLDYPILREDGSIRLLHSRGEVLVDGQGEVLGMRGTCQDITARHQAEQALRESEGRFRAAFDDSAVGMALVSMDKTYMRVNPAMCRITGYSENELLGRDYLSITHPDDVEESVRTAEAMIAGEIRVSQREKRYVRPDGSIVWVLLSSSLIRDDSGTPLYFVGQNQDITARKLQEDRFRALVQNSADTIVVADVDGIVTYASPSIERISGYTPEDLIGRSVFDFVAPEEREEGMVRMRESMSNPGSSITFERIGVRADGTKAWLEVTLTNLLHDPSVGGIVRNVRDITERKEAEDALREAFLARSKYAAILQSSADAIVGTDAEGMVSSWNQAAAKLFGYPSEEMIGRPLATVLPHDLDPEGASGARIEPAEAEFETLALTKEGVLVDVAVTLSPIKDEDGNFVGLSGIVRDISERKELEGQLRQAQKMEAVGRLAGGVAHDFNNLLTAILGYCEILLEDGQLSPQVKKDIEEIQQAAQVGESVAGQLLDISRRRVLRPEIIELDKVVGQMEPVIRRLLGEDVEVHVRPAGRSSYVLGDPGQLEQVMLNLTVNARDAMPRGGTFEIKLQSLDAGDPSIPPLLAPGPYVMLTARDSGLGMDPEVREHVFEPFFTTKEKRKGSGLGLSIVYQIVTQSSGHVDVQSEVGRGTTFRVFLPRSVAGSPRANGHGAPSDPSGTETILVVEDERAVRAVTCRALAARGYRVLEAASGADALAIAREHKGSIDLLLTDVVMPGMNGPALAERLRLLLPTIHVCYMSGYTGDVVLDQGLTENAPDFLAKPFRSEALARKVRAILDRSNTSASS